MSAPEGHIYDRIAAVAGVSRECAQDACELARIDGLSVQTYANAARVVVAFRALGFLR